MTVEWLPPADKPLLSQPILMHARGRLSVGIYDGQWKVTRGFARSVVAPPEGWVYAQSIIP